jgi:hypothetical protein
MKSTRLLGTLGFLVIAAVAVAARGETFPLTTKQLDQQTIARAYQLYYTAPQSFFFQFSPDDKVRVGPENPELAKAFKKLVTKEPKYRSAHPFRGVVKLGSQQYAFVLDTETPKSVKPKSEKKAAAEKAKDDKKDAKGDKAKKDDKAAKKPTPPKPETQYARLYFDLNHNGDLTDDKPIDGKAMAAGMFGPGQNFLQVHFPRVELTIDVDGAKQDYAFLLSGYVVCQRQFSYASLSLVSAICREGDITLAGHKHHVVLLDFNSNGRFDDEIKINSNAPGDGRLYPEQSDQLLVDPSKESGSPYDVAASTSRHHVTKLICVDGLFYDMKVSAAGDKLTLERSKLGLGRVSNPNQQFHAVVYGEHGYLKISGSKDAPAVLPEGQWKLLSYSIKHTDPPKPAKSDDKADKDKAKKSPSSGNLLSALGAMLGGRPASRESSVEATATAQYKPVTVRVGKTTELPFGPPYKPVVTASPGYDGPVTIVNGKPSKPPNVMQMGLELIGSAGEVCSSMTVHGSRPGKPAFTITDSKGKVVQQGDFEYG